MKISYLGADGYNESFRLAIPRIGTAIGLS
jgi:hypothetical protein